MSTVRDPAPMPPWPVADLRSDHAGETGAAGFAAAVKVSRHV